MRIHRVYISNLSEKKESYQIDKAQSVYLSKVLRLSDGDIIECFNGINLVAEAKLFFKKNLASVEVKSFKVVFKENDVILIPIIPLLKKESSFLLIQKLTELGADRIYMYKPDKIDQSMRKKNIVKFLKKLRDISVNACRQSLRNIVPEIIFKESMEAILETCDANKETQLIAFNTGDHQIIRNNDIKNKSIINLITGAESGFSSNEIQLLNNRNFIFRSLGSNILKAETAPIVSSSIIKNYIDCHK
jgi:16S rRNA (uracil1498-N3)-methyltransferase